MTEQTNATIVVNISEGSFTISGSEDFVEKNRDEVFAFLDKHKISIKEKVIPNVSEQVQVSQNNAEPLQESKVINDDKYIKAGIYSVDPDDGSIAIHRKVPGNNNADKTKNIALIVLYQRKEKIFGTEIRDLCIKQGCLDASNFAKTFDSDIKNFIKKKVSSQKWTLALTIDGEAAATALLEEMVNAAK